jgi:hypothetical protein
LGGDAARVKLSNVFGKEPLKIGAAHIALSAGGAAIEPGSDRALTFSGLSSIWIPAGGVVLSDPVSLKVPAFANVAISLFLPDSAIASTVHYGAQQKNYAAAGDVTGSNKLSEPVEVNSWPYLSSLDVQAPRGRL